MAASSGKEKICVLLTGGTICSVPNSNGKNTSDAGKTSLRLIKHYRDKTDSKYRGKVDFDTVSLKTDILSENMTTDVWFEILQTFKKKILPKDYKGVIVLHGTDTLAYTSSFLSMALAGIKIPVIMVSAQLRLGKEVEVKGSKKKRWIPEKKTNGYANFKAAVELIMNGIAPNVYAVYRNEKNEQNGKHEPGELLVHYGSHLLQCPNGSNNFHSRDEMLIKNVRNAKLRKCTGFKKDSCDLLKAFSNRNEVCLVRPYTNIDYSGINLKGKKIVIHGTYHSESVCIGRTIYGKSNGTGKKKSRDNYRLDEILEKDRKYSILFLLDECAKKKIPVFLAPCDKEAAAYGTTANAIKRGAKHLKGITIEAAYAKAVLGCFLGKQGKSFINFMSTDINAEKSDEVSTKKAKSGQGSVKKP
jgi:L-asparaginase